MRQRSSIYGLQEWNEAQRRAEIYLRTWRGQVGPAERKLLCLASDKACEQSFAAPSKHPVTLVMESLFDLLPEEDAPVAMTPPIQRTRMLPEATEFPVHDVVRQISRTLLFALPR
ncbi:MAG: hypothetical protein ACR2G0_08035 [Chthoniobacterales bacterium]